MISQQAFDAMVLENVEDFELEKSEALAETINQLRKMGKDLSNIDITGGEGREELLILINDLKDIVQGNKSEDHCLKVLGNLTEMCSDKHILSQRNQNLTRTSGGLSALINIISFSFSPSVLTHVFNLLNALCKTNVDNRDCFEPWGNKKLVVLINSEILHEFVGNETTTTQMLIACVRCAKILSKSELNKAKLVEYGIGEFMHRVLCIKRSEIGDAVFATELVQEVCILFKKLCTHDDIRKEMSCAYENGRRFLSEGFVPLLMALASDFRNETDLAVAALGAVRQIVVSEEAVKAVCLNGAMELPALVFSWESSPILLIRSVTGLMRNLCADDDRKHRLVADETLNKLISHLATIEMSGDLLFVEHAFACCAAMTLRSPNNSKMLIDIGAIEHIIAGMRRHPDKPALQRQACLAFRNIAARCPDLHHRLLDAGVEEVLRTAGRMQESVDEAYAALRDLNVDVQFVRIGENGMASMAFDQFGGSKPKFNPVFDETYDIEQRVVDESVAPFANDKSSSVFRATTDNCLTDGCSHDHH